MEDQAQLKQLENRLGNTGSLVVAYSGGLDSTFLLKAAHTVLKDRVMAVTARSPIHPEREIQEAAAFTHNAGIAHIVIESNELDIEGFAENPPDRCYLCKLALFSKIREVALQHRFACIAEGSNLDDLDDYRPGMRAVRELGITSPLKDAGLRKEAIRRLAKQMELPHWNKPAFACLASRFPYGVKITAAKLAMVDRAEQFLIDLGFQQVRVRHHGDTARIEVGEAERLRFLDPERMEKVYQQFRDIGFAYAALDLKGYRTGSMNEVLNGGKEQGL